jgi:hypothetical protein
MREFLGIWKLQKFGQCEHCVNYGSASPGTTVHHILRGQLHRCSTGNPV